MSASLVWKGLAYSVKEILNTSIWCCRYLCRRTKIQIPVIASGCESWTLNSCLKGWVNVFSIAWLHRIMEYRWNGCVSNERSLCEVDSRSITILVRQRQLRLYGHLAPVPEVGPAHWVVSVRDNHAWRRLIGLVQISWWDQIDRSCPEVHDWESDQSRDLPQGLVEEWQEQSVSRTYDPLHWSMLH